MPDVPLHPASIARYDTVSHHQGLLDGPDATPYRFNWRAVHGTQLAQDFKHALKRLEGLLYVIWGGQPMYAADKQWWAREHPRCRWGPEQWWQHPVDIGDDWFWEYLETGALGSLYAGAVPSVPTRSRSGDPAVQFKRAAHSQYFPLGSVQRYCGAPGNTGHAAHDPASTFKQFPAWPDAENVTVRYAVPPGLGETVDAVYLVTASGAIQMQQVQAGIYEATLPPESQGVFRGWCVMGLFGGVQTPHYDPFVGLDPYGVEIAPNWPLQFEDPEHDWQHGMSYTLTWFTHYNPYAHGLPELLDETPPHLPGNWLRRGTDEYRFDSSENIQPGLINLARFILDHIGRRFQHSPRIRDAPENCCIDMPIEWRWSGSHTPDLYRAGGKGGASGTQPLHNNPTESDAGSENARKSWRGIEMAWTNADPPGLWPDNWWYGDDESWLAWPEQLVLDPDPLNPPWKAIVRSYGQRGLQPGDAIDPVHLQEIIDAVDYLCEQGLWRMTQVSTAKRTADTAFGKPCGWWWTHNEYPSGGWEDSGVDLDNKCCQAVIGGQCIPWPKPTWAECQGMHEYCHHVAGYGRNCWDDNYHQDWWLRESESVICNSAGSYDGQAQILNEYTGNEFGEGYHDRAENCESEVHGASYWLCGPARTESGPVGDPLHGNGLRKIRWDHEHNYAEAGPSMGNRYGQVEHCAVEWGVPKVPVGFQEVVGVTDDGITGAWYKYDLCSVGRLPDYQPPPPIPGLGLWNWERTEPLYELLKVHEPAYDYQRLSAQVDLGDFPVCMPGYVWVSVDLNKDGDGVPRLYDYDLNIPDPFDECPCETWTGVWPCQ